MSCKRGSALSIAANQPTSSITSALHDHEFKLCCVLQPRRVFDLVEIKREQSHQAMPSRQHLKKSWLYSFIEFGWASSARCCRLPSRATAVPRIALSLPRSF